MADLFFSDFTDEEIEAALLLASKLSNKNLLHNWDFKNPVNQRGLTSYTSDQNSNYTIDKWCTKLYQAGSMSVDSSGVTITGAKYMGLSQPIENSPKLIGKTVTLSVNVAAISGVWALDLNYDINIGTSVGSLVITTTGIKSYTVTIPDGITTLWFTIYTGSDTSDSITVSSVKLELGSVSTLANDPPADYGEQLALCQRYALALPASKYRAVEYTENAITFFIPTPVTMRTNPALSVAPVVQTVAGVAQSDFTFAYTVQANGIKVVATKTAHGLTDASLAVAACVASADL